MWTKPRMSLIISSTWVCLQTIHICQLNSESEFVKAFTSGFNQLPFPVKTTAKMGRVRTKTIKKASRVIIEKYYTRLTLDFHTNKRICEEIAIIPSKKLKNKIAGFVTHLMKRIQKGPVRGISIKLQEEERERRDNFVPETSAIENDILEVDADTKEMLKMLDMANIPGLQVTQPMAGTQGFRPAGGNVPGGPRN